MENGESSYRRFREDGDDSGLREIILEYRDGLIIFLKKITGDYQRAEDLAEDTFVALGTKKPKFRGESSFKTWLYGIGRNIAINSLRKDAKNRHITVSIEEVREPVSEETAVEDVYCKTEQKKAVHRALRRLSPDHQQVLWLVYFEGMSSRDAATIMKKTVRGLESVLYRAKKSLRTQLEKDGFHYEG
ncbi:MAG: RNA polymerase sigma factor [Clostridia bacterium]|nr:RNA polymerase sigma factor [Clostridia bacterium]